MKKIILDTDIGTNVDDLMALVLTLYSPEIELMAVTTSFGDTLARANLASQIIKAKDSSLKIPIAPGNPNTISNTNSRKNENNIWKHNINSNIPSKNDYQEKSTAVDLILDTISTYPDEITICCIAPLTNIAEAIKKRPDIMKKVKDIYVMGGVFGIDNRQFLMPYTEHNVRNDPEAAKIVFNSGLPIVLFPLDVTFKIPFTEFDAKIISNAKDTLHQLLFSEICSWFEFLKREMNTDHSELHDPLTLAALIDSSIIVKTVQTTIVVETKGKFTTGATLPQNTGNNNVTVVLEADISRFFEIFTERVMYSAKK